MSRYFGRLRVDLAEKNTKQFLYLLVSLWKLVLFLCLFIGFALFFERVTDFNELFNHFKTRFTGYGGYRGFGILDLNLPLGITIVQACS